MAEKEALQKEYSEARAKADQNREETEKSQSLYKKLLSENDQLKNQVTNLTTKIDDGERSFRSIESDKASLHDQIKSLNSEVLSKTTEINELKTKLSESDKELERSLQGLEKKFTSASKRLTSLVEENKSLRVSMDRSKREHAELHHNLQAKDKELKRLADRSEQTQSLVASLNKERADLSSEQGRLLNEAKQLREELASFKQKHQELEKNCTDLRTQLETTSKELEKARESSGNNQEGDVKKVQSLEEQLVRERSLTKFLNERLVDQTSSRTPSRPSSGENDFRSMPGEDVFEACDELKLELRETAFRLEKEINNKKDLISKLRFTETRLASASFEIQSMSSQIKKLKSIVVNANLDIDLEEILSEIEPVEINHEKLILEVEYLKGQLEAEKIVRLDAENAAAALHTKFRQIQRSDSSSDIFRLKYEASDLRVKSLESRITSHSLRDRTNTGNREIFTHRESIAKYEEDLRFYRLENYKLQDLLVESEKQINSLSKCVKQHQTDRAAMNESMVRLKKDLEVAERQNELLSTSARNHKVQYESCVDDLQATEEQLKDMIHTLRQSEEDIKTMTSIIERLKSQNRQKDRQLWEIETRNNDLESEVEEKTIDMNKLQSRIEILSKDLTHFKERVRVAGDQTQYVEEINKLKSELDSSLRLETELKKDISSLNYSLES